MSFNLSAAEAVYVGLDGLNLDPKSWQVQFDGLKPENPVAEYGHGADGATGTAWLRFTVSQEGANVVLQGNWNLLTGEQTLQAGSSAADLKTVTQKPFNNKPFIEPGIDALGSHVWLRHGVTESNKTKEYRFQTPLHLDLGKTGDALKLLGLLRL